MDLLRLTLRQGAVFYMQDRRLTSADSHFFIVLNHTPLDDRVLLLVVSTSQIAAVKLRRRSMPPESVVELGPNDYAGFTKPSAIDCNTLFEMTLGELRERVRTKQAKSLCDLPTRIVEKLVRGVLASPMVTQPHKDMLCA